MTLKQKTKNLPFPKKKTGVANLQENKQESSQENVKKEEISEVEEKDFSIYDEFFNVKNTQLKRADQIVNNLSASRH